MESQETKDLRAENAKLQKNLQDKEAQIVELTKERDALAASSGSSANEELETLRAKVLSLEQANKNLQESTGIYQLNETFTAEDGKKYGFVAGRRKFILKGQEFTAEDAIKNPAIMNELIEKKYSGIELKGGQ